MAMFLGLPAIAIEPRGDLSQRLRSESIG
jgi:hypothetical protein